MSTLRETLAEAHSLGLLKPGSDEALELEALEAERVRAARQARIETNIPGLLNRIRGAQNAAAPVVVRLPQVPNAPTDRFIWSRAFQGSRADTLRGETYLVQVGKVRYALALHSCIGFVDAETWAKIEPVLNADGTRRHKIHVSPEGAALEDVAALGLNLEHDLEPLIHGACEDAMPIIARWWQTLVDTGEGNLSQTFRRWCCRNAGLNDPREVMGGTSTIKPWKHAEAA